MVERGSRIRKRWKDDGAKGRHERMQPPRPNVGEGIIYQRIEQGWDFEEMNEKVVPMWCRGTIVAAKRNSRVHIRWDGDNVREGEPNIMEERFLVSKWNKQVDEGWCFVISED